MKKEKGINKKAIQLKVKQGFKYLLRIYPLSKTNFCSLYSCYMEYIWKQFQTSVNQILFWLQSLLHRPIKSNYYYAELMIKYKSLSYQMPITEGTLGYYACHA